MKKVSLYIILFSALPLRMLAQYVGGNGRGESSIAVNINMLSGGSLNLYGGGSGRGESLVYSNTNQLSGTKVNLYGGGNGRGESLVYSNTNQLSGTKVDLYGGGNGRGEVLTAVNTNQLDGSKLSMFGGGNGRGESSYMINTNQTSGTMTIMFFGGNGRGELASQANTLQLDGVTASIFMGGSGRGETMIQLNTLGLPAQFICFGATPDAQQVKVYWQTSSERNSDNFVVEKSIDSNNWQPIGTVKAAGNSTTLLNYQLHDPNPIDGPNYYRLKTTRLDSKFMYSQIATVYFRSTPVTRISVYPNPAKDQFTLSINNNQKTVTGLNLKMISANGQTVLERQGLSGNTQTIDVSNLTSGTYFLVINLNGETSKVQVIKQ